METKWTAKQKEQEEEATDLENDRREAERKGNTTPAVISEWVKMW